MKTIKIIAVTFISLLSSNYGNAQFSPVQGGQEKIGNGTENTIIGFGLNTFTAGTKGFGLASAYSSSSTPLPQYSDRVLQMTNLGALKIQSVRPNDASSFSLMRNNTTYGTMDINGDHLNLIARNYIKLSTDNNHHIATFHANSVSFYDNLTIEKNDIVVQLGLDDARSAGWIGATSESGCYFGAGGHNNMYMDTHYKTYMGGISATEAAGMRSDLKNKYSLFVKKGVLAEDLAIAPNASWSDFVFDENYELPSLTEVEQFIKENKHLPDVPSQKEVAKNGYSQHDVNKALLQKVEELTLYVIELQKQIEVLNAEKNF